MNEEKVKLEEWRKSSKTLGIWEHVLHRERERERERESYDYDISIK